MLLFFFSSRRRHTRWPRDWSSDVCSSDLRLPRALDCCGPLGICSAREGRSRREEPPRLTVHVLTSSEKFSFPCRNSSTKETSNRCSFKPSSMASPRTSGPWLCRRLWSRSTSTHHLLQSHGPEVLGEAME